MSCAVTLSAPAAVRAAYDRLQHHPEADPRSPLGGWILLNSTKHFPAVSMTEDGGEVSVAQDDSARAGDCTFVPDVYQVCACLAGYTVQGP